MASRSCKSWCRNVVRACALAVLLGACWTGQEPAAETPANSAQPTDAPHAPPWFTSAGTSIAMERTGCMGFCPSYTVTIYGIGEVAWLGEANVTAIGARRGRATPSGLAQISRAIDNARLFERDEDGRLPQKPNCVRTANTVTCSMSATTMCSDTPHAILTVRRGGQTHTVDDPHCSDADPALDALEQLIDKVASTQEWIH